MKYTIKTAIEIMTEEDRKEVIPFFESIIPNCNNGFWREDEIRVGEIWILNEHLLLNWRERKLLSDYTILKGVPKDWREESEPTEPSRLDQLESENKELRELLKNIVGCTRQSGNGRNRLNDNKLGVFHIAIQKAKQLLEK